MRHVLTILFALAISLSSLGQSGKSILDRKISLNVEGQRLPEVLLIIGREGKFSFSYNSAIVGEDQLITLRAKDKTIREILNEIFKGSMDYKEKSNHIILTKVAIKQSQAVTSVIVSGYVADASTGERIPDVSIYDKRSISSVVTDEYGYFRMKLETKDNVASIAVSKRDYLDTLLNVTASGNQYVNIAITPIHKDTLLVNESLATEDSLREELPMPYADEPNVQNISDTLYRDIQISLFPFVGSNGSLSGNVINNYSINIFGGYSLGTREIELGFFVNLDRGDVSWLQVAGIGNVVGRNVYGLQASGFFNVNGGETKAAQLTGFGNVNFRDFQGVQVAGFTNVNLQSADGVQIAGFLNLAKAPSHGVQVAGISNVQTSHFTGSQFAGITNIASRHLSGSQVSGLFNYGKNVRGTQIGLINFADSLGGVPIGLVSFVNHGYHKLEISADEVFYTNLAFRTGARKFYNILLAGFKPEVTTTNTTVWTFGYGLGMAPSITRWLQLNLDITAQHINNGSFTNELSLLNKVHLGLDFQLAKKFSMYGGVTLNGYLTNPGYTDYPVLFTDYHPTIINDHTFNNDMNLKMWWGFKVGLRFL